MTKRIFRSICLVAISVFLASAVLIMGAQYNYFSSVSKKQLRAQTDFAARGVENDGIAYLDGLSAGDYRITWIDRDGTVLFDSKSDTAGMENHLERAEIISALESGYGESSRYSSTLMQRSIYCAKRLENGTVIRLSEAQNTVLTLLLGMAQPVMLVFIAAVLLSLFLARRLSENIVKPLNGLNLDAPLENTDCYDELSPLLRRIDTQQRQLQSQRDKLQKKQDELDAVTSSMNEGLVLLNSSGCIISINNAAARLFNTDSSCIGSDILTVNRTLEMQQLIEKAMSGVKCEKNIAIDNGIYQLDASPVTDGGTVSAVALLVFDVTERENAEQMRREFTANVSHELKTPLQSISGYSELLENGMVKPHDIKSFAGKIHTESQRMISLVEDIIGLSRLDEGGADMQREPVDLYAVAVETADSLYARAKKAGVEISVSGGSCIISGIPQLLNGIVYNLCDNAIKYNRDGGSVQIDCAESADEVTLTVSDTGIGIAPEHRSRIFERFYCVDKSRSRQVGGTGLGLSIVKHAAIIHNARIQLESEENRGTVITVTFPKNQQ